MSYRVRVWVLVAAACVACASKGACATDAPATADTGAWRETSFGSTVQAHAWSLYGSSTFAPLGDIRADGVRVRLGSGYGQYQYERPRHCYDRVAKVELFPCPDIPIKGRVSFGDVLAGYQISNGRFTMKAFGGVAIDTQAVKPWDDGNLAAGRATGAKAVVETWTNINERLWAQVDGSWTRAHDGESVQARLGYRLTPDLSIGIEDAKARNVAGHQFRSGVFGRYEWTGGEAVMSGGYSGDHIEDAVRTRTGMWGAASVMLRY